MAVVGRRPRSDEYNPTSATRAAVGGGGGEMWMNSHHSRPHYSDYVQVIGRPKTECEPHHHQQLRQQCRTEHEKARRSAGFPPKHDIIRPPDCFGFNGPTRDADFPAFDGFGNGRHPLDRTEDVPSPEPAEEPEDTGPPLIGRRFPPSFPDLQCRRPLLAEAGMTGSGEIPASGSRSNCLHLLHERRLSSDYDVARSVGGASDLEVNMESEADVQALNASEEDVVCAARTPAGSLMMTRRCHDDRRRGRRRCRDDRRGRRRCHDDRRGRRRRRSRDDSSLDDSSESESDSSETSSNEQHQQQQSLLDRLRHCKPLNNLRAVDSSADDELGLQATDMDWEQLLAATFDPADAMLLGPDEMFSLNRNDVLYAQKYAAARTSAAVAPPTAAGALSDDDLERCANDLDRFVNDLELACANIAQRDADQDQSESNAADARDLDLNIDPDQGHLDNIDSSKGDGKSNVTVDDPEGFDDDLATENCLRHSDEHVEEKDNCQRRVLSDLDPNDPSDIEVNNGPEIALREMTDDPTAVQHYPYDPDPEATVV